MKVISYFKLPQDIVETIESFANYYDLSQKKQCIEDVEDADVIIGNVKLDLLSHCKSLKYLQLISAGSDQYQKFICDDYTICNASGTFGAGIAEHLIMNTLMLFRNMPHYVKAQREHRYDPLRYNKSIYGSRFLICGCGDIGSQFAMRIKSLGGYTIGVKRRACDSLPYFDEVYTEKQMEDLLPTVDAIALCLPRNKSTDLFLNKERLSLLKDDAIVLNVGRGNAVDTNALCSLLNEEKLLGAALDVFEKEPIDENDAIWDCNRMIITPHVSGTFANAYTYELFYSLVRDNIHRFKEGKELVNVLDKETGYRK